MTIHVAKYQIKWIDLHGGSPTLGKPIYDTEKAAKDWAEEQIEINGAWDDVAYEIVAHITRL